MKLVANSVTKTHICLPFLLLASTADEIGEKELPPVKFEIQLRENLFSSAKLENFKICENKLPRISFMPHGKSIRFSAIAGSRLTSSKTTPIFIQGLCKAFLDRQIFVYCLSGYLCDQGRERPSSFRLLNLGIKAARFIEEQVSSTVLSATVCDGHVLFVYNYVGQESSS